MKNVNAEVCVHRYEYKLHDAHVQSIFYVYSFLDLNFTV